MAAVVLAATAVGAAMLQRGPGSGSIAAHVGAAKITASGVDREVGAIESQPTYRAALAHASTLALAAPVDPKAVAATVGDPDDLRVTLVPAGGTPSTRAYSAADLRASVLTRQVYVTVLEQLLAARHVTTTPTDLAFGRQQARVESGVDRAGVVLFDRLPGWYQQQLAQRGADILALQRSLVGSGGITDAQVQAAYERRMATDFTTVCLRSALAAPGDVPAARAALTGGTGGRDAGCAPMSAWAPDVVADVGSTPVGAIGAPLRRGDRVALLAVSRRTVAPLAEVAGNVRAVLSSRYTDAVNAVIEAQLGLTPVTVAAQFGTYEDLGSVHGILPPDALATPTPASPTGPPATGRPQHLDPFD